VAERLKLRAVDEADVAIVAACLQDALVPLADMTWLRDEGRFAMVVNRFMWEAEGEAIAGAERFGRVHGLLSVQAVTDVRLRGLDQTRRGRMLSLLSLRPGPGSLDLEFAGGGTIRLAVERIDCVLEDLGEPWPTRLRPAHPLDGGDSSVG